MKKLIQLSLEIDNERFLVDNYMGCYYIPFEEADDSYQWHVSELNHGQYKRIHKELVEYQNEIGIEPTMTFDRFLTIAERMFEMYSILRKL